MEVGAVDVPTAVTAILTVIMAVGGTVGKKYFNEVMVKVSEAVTGVSAIADVLAEFNELLIAISKAGADGKLDPEEWEKIKAEARDVQTVLLKVQGKFGSVFKKD